MAASSEEVGKKVDKFMDLVTEMGHQLKDLREAIQRNTNDLREIEKAQDQHSVRIRDLEMGREKDRAEREIDRTRMSYMEDQLRRSNLRLRGFNREFAEGGEVTKKICQWLNDNNIGIVPEDVERAHWALGIRREGAPKDIIIKFNSARKAEEVFKDLRKITDLSFKQHPIRVLRDFSSQTLQERKKMRPIAELLYRNSIGFSWQYPATILIIRDGRSYRAKTIEEGRRLLAKFGVALEPEMQSEGVVAMEQEWRRERDPKEKATLVDPFAPMEKRAVQEDSLKIRELEEELAKLKAKPVEKEMELEQRVTRQQQKKK